MFVSKKLQKNFNHNQINLVRKIFYIKYIMNRHNITNCSKINPPLSMSSSLSFALYSLDLFIAVLYAWQGRPRLLGNHHSFFSLWAFYFMLYHWKDTSSFILWRFRSSWWTSRGVFNLCITVVLFIWALLIRKNYYFTV